jgi:hypothetical protein
VPRGPVVPGAHAWIRPSSSTFHSRRTTFATSTRSAVCRNPECPYSLHFHTSGRTPRLFAMVQFTDFSSNGRATGVLADTGYAMPAIDYVRTK